MTVLQMLHCLSKPLPKKLQRLLEVRYLFRQKCQLVSMETTRDSFPPKKQRSPRKYLSPILRQELGVKMLEIHRFYRNGALEVLDKYLLKHRLCNLREMGFANEDIKAELSVLLVPTEKVWTRRAILEECGVTKVTTALLSQYGVVSRRRIGLLKASGLIPREMNVPENILSYSGVDIPAPNFNFLRKARFMSATATADALPLEDLHKYVVLHYIAWYFDDRNVSKSRRLFKPKSLRQIIQAYDALQNLNVQKSQLAKCLYLSHCDSKKLDDLLYSYPKIGGEDLEKIIQKHPKVALCSSSDVRAVLQCIQKYGLTEESVAAYPAILAVDVNDLRQGLNLLKSLPDLWALRYSESILRLLCQKQIVSKLQYLKSLPRKVVPTVNLLASANAAISRALQRSSSRRSVTDFLKLVSEELKTDIPTVRAILSRHPRWRSGSAGEMFSTLCFLRSHGFRDADILQNLQILLYSRLYIQDILEEKLGPVSCAEEFSRIFSKTDLGLCLYYIEKQHGFTGMGITEGPESTEKGQIKFVDRCKGKPCQRDCATNPLCSLKVQFSSPLNRKEKQNLAQ